MIVNNLLTFCSCICCKTLFFFIPEIDIILGIMGRSLYNSIWNVSTKNDLEQINFFFSKHFWKYDSTEICNKHISNCTWNTTLHVVKATDWLKNQKNLSISINIGRNQRISWACQGARTIQRRSGTQFVYGIDRYEL